MGIKNIIFDLGGVIIDIDFGRTSRAFKQLGAERFDEIFNQHDQDSLFDDYETGKITSAVFREKLREKLGIRATDGEFDRAWNAMLLDMPKPRLDFIKALRKDYSVFLFSNTNDIHLRAVFEICRRQHGFAAFDDYFDREYYSYTLGMRKPDPEAFTAIVTANNLRADETLFVDDALRNVLGAREANLFGLHLSDGKSIFDTLDCVGEINRQNSFS